ncbi:hypothetical protein ACWEQO_26420 [Streptomyces sp. NPDC004051]
MSRVRGFGAARDRRVLGRLGGVGGLRILPGGAKPDCAAAIVREQLQKHTFGLAMIGGGIRMLPENTLLFERLVNVLTEEAPWVRLCFNTTPEDTIEALRRWIQA